MASDAQLTTDVLLGDVATFRSGSVFKPDEQGQRSGDIPFIKVSDLNLPSNSHKIEESNNWLTLQSAKRLGTTIHPAGATVFAKIGVALTYNRRRLLIRDTAIDNNLMSAIPNPSKIRPEFLYHTLRCLDFNEIAKGSALPYINIGDLKGLRVRLPSLPEQEEICSLLDALDDRIDLLRQTNSTLEAIAQALFKSWFVDFDPVRAKAEGREPEGTDAATAAIFPSEFEESELRLIPKGWRWSTLGHVTAKKGGVIQTGPFGSQLHASDYQPAGVPVVMPQDLAGRRVSEDRIARVSESEADRLSRHRLKSGDIVFSRRGDVGRHAIVSEREVGWLCGTGCLLVRPAEDESISTFVSAALARPESLEWLVRHAVGATMPNLNTKILSALPLVWPCDEVVRAYEALASPLDHRVSANLVQAQSLAQLRDTLLPRLISGKLRLPEAEKLIEEAVA